MMKGLPKNCVISYAAQSPEPVSMCTATSSTASPLEFDAVTCTKTGRPCTNVDELGDCLALGPETTITVSDDCVDARTESAYRFCAGATTANGGALDRAFIHVDSYQRNVTCPARRSPTPPLDRSFGLAVNSPFTAAIGSTTQTFTTKGGRAIVTYACDGSFCVPQTLKDFELDVNDATVLKYPFKNIKLVATGPIPINADNTLSTSGPGFDLSALVSGFTVKNHVNPSTPIQLTGSYSSATFGIGAQHLNFPLGIMGGAMTVTGSINVSGTPGGVQINCGNYGAIPPFIADTDFSGGAEKNRTPNIDLTKVLNPAPMRLYQNQHYASPFTYTIPGFTPGSNHLIRLHFAETNPLNAAPNRRKFSVAINGTTEISNLDLFATVGMNTAYIKEFTLPANSSGKYVLSFTASLDSATISGIEVL
jgi:hypothetical protein